MHQILGLCENQCDNVQEQATLGEESQNPVDNPNAELEHLMLGHGHGHGRHVVLKSQFGKEKDIVYCKKTFNNSRKR